MLRIATLLVTLLVTASLASAASPDGRLKKIAASKKISIAYRTDALPFSFADDRKQPTGYTVDLCKRVVASIERQLGIQDLQIRWVPVTAQNRFDAVAKGQADMECGSSTVTLGRMKQVDFSSFVFVESTGVLTTTKTGIRTAADLAGKRVSVIGGTTNERTMRDLGAKRQLNLTLVPVKTREEGLAALEEGRADAFAGDKLLLIGAGVGAKDQAALYLLPDDLSIEPYAIVLPRGDASLRLAVNTALARIYREGEIVPIFARYFGPLGEPSPALQAMYVFGALSE